MSMCGTVNGLGFADRLLSEGWRDNQYIFISPNSEGASICCGLLQTYTTQRGHTDSGIPLPISEKRIYISSIVTNLYPCPNPMIVSVFGDLLF